MARMPMNRRKFIQLAAGAGAASLVVPVTGCGARAQAGGVPVGVQLYCVRRELAVDMPGTIAQVAEMGYEGVEFADYFGRSASEIRTMLSDNGLKCCGTHIYLEDLLGDNLPATIDFNQEIENENLIIRWINDDQRDSRESFMSTIDQYNEISEQLRPHGMRAGYHNHDYIFQSFNGEMLWDILADHTTEDFVLQLDTGHAAGIGQDVVQLIRRNPGRTASMHVKPWSATDEAAFLGDDDLDWPEIFGAAESIGRIEWYIIEYEVDAYPPLEALEANLANFRAMRV